MSPLERFLHAYLHFSVTQRLFEDTCRQLRDCEGAAERKALVDETLRLAISVSELSEDAENLLPGARSYARMHDVEDPDLIDTFDLISNNIEEDRGRATSFAMFLTARRMGGSRKPRPPQVANPMRFAFEEETKTDSDILEEDDDPEELPDEEDDSGSNDDSDDPGFQENGGSGDDEECNSDHIEGTGEEDRADDAEEHHQSAYRRRLIIEEENARADDPLIFYPEEQPEPEGDPLAEGSDGIAIRRLRDSDDPDGTEESRWISRPSSPSF